MQPIDFVQSLSSKASAKAAQGIAQLVERLMVAPPANQPCFACGVAADALLSLNTYKRSWYLCPECGCASSVEKDALPFQGLSVPDLRRAPEADQQSIYDYFVEPIHVEYSVAEGQALIRELLEPNQVELSGKRVLDISGGNGHVAAQLEARGAQVTLTEINQRALAYARDELGLETVEFDLNAHALEDRVEPGSFDVVLVRASVMFCRDLGGLCRSLARVLKPSGGVVVFQHCVRPTLGVLVRVQLDDFSYAALRQPETIVAGMQAEGFELQRRYDETDPSLYVYDHDLTLPWFVVHYLYEIAGAWRLKQGRLFDFPARDRRRSHLLFRKR